MESHWKVEGILGTCQRTQQRRTNSWEVDAPKREKEKKHGCEHYGCAISILNDEVIRLEARPNSQPTILATPTAQPPPPASNHNSTPSNIYSSRGNPWPTPHMSYPNWAWWTPPPCPCPTQPPWRPNRLPAQVPPPPQQAHFSGYSDPSLPLYQQQPHTRYNVLCPSDLSTAMAHLQVNPPNSTWTSDIMNTGASSHLTHDPGKIIIPNSRYPDCTDCCCSLVEAMIAAVDLSGF
ncbi:hypothetical protein E3N88_15731 [Mikania micrantha]|uniref:Uncharacterized protein n=1 Tax=Mikania micrantha TaxID=192012 RepID=A0A5N6NY23_9ASTR|nr:hypothetical protein E3N88_15731 [Mikania micrantha]